MIRKRRTVSYGVLWKIDSLHRNAQSRNKLRCIQPSSIMLTGMEEKSMKKGSSEKALDDVKQSAIFEQRGGGYRMAVSHEQSVFSYCSTSWDALRNIESN